MIIYLSTHILNIVILNSYIYIIIIYYYFIVYNPVSYENYYFYWRWRRIKLEILVRQESKKDWTTFN